MFHIRWASGRETTRTEDIAYCLLGIFDVNMPLVYGEGHKAFYRLQEQIIRESGDDTILAWDYFKAEHRDNDIDYENVLLAPSPDFFRDCKNVQHCRSAAWTDVVDLTNHGLRFKSHYIRGSSLGATRRDRPYSDQNEAALLNCYREDAPELRYALRLQQYKDSGTTERGYSVRPQARNGVNHQDMLWAMSMGLCTRLVLVDRNGEYAATGRETSLITKHILAEKSSFHLRINLSPTDRLEFEIVLRPAYSYTNVNGEWIAQPLRNARECPSETEIHSGTCWSATFPAQSRQKLIIGGACIRDRNTRESFMLIYGHQDPDIQARRTDDGDCGVELHTIFESTRLLSPDYNSHSIALLALSHNLRKSRNIPQKKECTLFIPGVGVVKASSSVIHSEKLTMNVEVVLVDEDQTIPRKEKGNKRYGRRFSSWLPRPASLER
jgi:hypothetical protein